jgi:leader peptidase (prepilin peptidase)/N-methyltransferase
MISVDGAEQIGPADDFRPNLAILIGGSTAIGLVSVVSLPGPVAVASIVLGVLMVAGADVDARTYLLPNVITWGAAICGVAAAWFLDELNPSLAILHAVLRAMGAAGLLALLRWSYGCIRHREGLGLGDVKLAAAVGAWLPLEVMPMCFALATSGALVTILWARLRGNRIEDNEDTARRLSVSRLVVCVLCKPSADRMIGTVGLIYRFARDFY